MIENEAIDPLRKWMERGIQRMITYESDVQRAHERIRLLEEQVAYLQEFRRGVQLVIRDRVSQ